MSEEVKHYVWRNIGGAMLRMPLVRQAVGHEEPGPHLRRYGLPEGEEPDASKAVLIVDPAAVLDNPPDTKKRRVRPRNFRSVNTLAIHQMDAVFGTTRGQRKKHGGAFRALIARMCMQPYHVAGLVSGPVVKCHRPHLYTYASSGANVFSVAVGLEGKWPRFERNRKKRHTEPTDQILATYKQAIRTAYGQATNWGAEILHFTPHCAWSANRAPDPGEWIWKNVVLPVCEDELGLTLRLDTDGGGILPPTEWERT